MSSLGDRLDRARKRVWEWSFPPRKELGAPLEAALQQLFPRLDWRRVSFHRGLPHVLSWWLPNSAITLPDRFVPWRLRVYVKRGYWNPKVKKGLDLILHESYHLLQMRESCGGWGLGLVRPFTILYVCCMAGVRFRYQDHPMERDAYCFAGRDGARFDRHEHPMPLDRFHPDAAPLSDDEHRHLERCCRAIVCEHSHLGFGARLVRSAPGLGAVLRVGNRMLRWAEAGGPSIGTVLRRLAAVVTLLPIGALAGVWVAVWFVLGALAMGLLGLIDLVLVGVGALAAGLLWIAARLAWPLDRLRGRPSGAAVPSSERSTGAPRPPS